MLSQLRWKNAWPFVLTHAFIGSDPSRRANERLDAIVRRPFGKDENFVPVGTVSKDYTLVPHGAALEITEYGERMRLAVALENKRV